VGETHPESFWSSRRSPVTISAKGEIRLNFQRDSICPVPRAKKFRFRRRANQWLLSARLTRQEGRLAIVTNVRWDAVDADVTTTNVAEADGEVVWFWRPTLAPSSREPRLLAGDGGKRARLTRESTK
jgi:hypothetical protein